jgi:electron transfer flavoprotein alpha subunit
MRLCVDEEKELYKNIWVLAAHDDAGFCAVTYEMLGVARRLADVRTTKVVAVLLSGRAMDPEPLFTQGADVVICCVDPVFSVLSEETEARVLARLTKKYCPETFLAAATTHGKAVLPRVAVQTECGLTANCMELSVDPETGVLRQTRPAFGGDKLAVIETPRHRPQMATVSPRVFAPLSPQPGRRGVVITEQIVEADKMPGKQILRVLRDVPQAADLSAAHRVVAGGRGVKGKQGFALLRTLADALGGAVGATRPCVEDGWIPYAQQIGQTGQSVRCDLYIACGISGQIHHTVGLRGCKTLVAIDTNPDTPLMRMADIAVTGDLFEIIPAFLKELKAGV